MSEKVTITLHCPCEKNHTFQRPFHVEGLGMTEVQVACPNPQCTHKGLLTFDIPWGVSKNDRPLKGGGGAWPFPEKPK
ncbi:MAG: hypothetical protein ACKVUS_03245 [Saprospiraceae bacterium]